MATHNLLSSACGLRTVHDSRRFPLKQRQVSKEHSDTVALAYLQTYYFIWLDILVWCRWAVTLQRLAAIFHIDPTHTTLYLMRRTVDIAFALPFPYFPSVLDSFWMILWLFNDALSTKQRWSLSERRYAKWLLLPILGTVKTFLEGVSKNMKCMLG